MLHAKLGWRRTDKMLIVSRATSASWLPRQGRFVRGNTPHRHSEDESANSTKKMKSPINIEKVESVNVGFIRRSPA
jgi:hypothetical protein